MKGTVRLAGGNSETVAAATAPDPHSSRPSLRRQIRVRTLGLALLLLVGVVPLAVFGFLALRRSERTALSEVRQGNQRVAEQVAGRIDSYLRRERELLATIGAAALQARDARDAATLIEGYSLQYRHLRDLVVYRRTDLSTPWASDITAKPGKVYPDLAAAAERDGAAASPVRAADPESSGGFAHTMTVAVAVIVAGQQRGVLVARMDLIGVWAPVNQVRIGHHGFVRLLSGNGELLAHGDPEERRYVFNADAEVDKAMVAAARAGELADNQGGEQVVPVVADVPGTDWMVVVEQPVHEAYASARAMRRDLLLIGAGVLVVAVVAGVILGRRVVRPLELLRAHTRTLAQGNLLTPADVPTSIAEVAALAGSLDEMAGALKRLQDDAQARERVTTFGRVAAGLAHDLRLPIERVHGACFDLMRSPEDEHAWEYFRRTAEANLPPLREYMADLLQLSRSGEIEKRVERIEPEQVAREVVAQVSANPKFADIEFHVAGSAAGMWVNKSLFRRAVHNLTANAAQACFKAGRPGTSVTVELSERDNELQVSVIDTGTGMTVEQREKVMHGDFSSGDRTSGIGLGLGVARHVAQGHGGLLEIASELGKGSTFTLRLPRIHDHAAQPQRISMSDVQEGASHG
jgi:signal transduction histidine kinase